MATEVVPALVPVKNGLALLNRELTKLSEPQQLALEQQAKELTAYLEKVVEVIDSDDYAAVLEQCKRAKGVEDDLDARFEPFVDASNSLHKGFIRWRDIGAGVDALSTARKAAAKKAGQWQQAEQERARQKVIAEQRERERQAEIARQLELEELEATGQVDAAEELAQAPLAPVAPPSALEPAVERVKGTTYVENWLYRIANPDVVPDEFWVIDEKRIAARVRSLKGDCRIAGVEVWAEGSVRTGAA